MRRWVKHYSELYCRKNTVVTAALAAIEPLSILEELDTEPTLEEVRKVIDNLIRDKAPGNDGIPPDLIRHCKTSLLQPPQLYGIRCQCWEAGDVQQGMRDANIVTLYKNNGDRGDCNNYRGIFPLLSIVGQLAKVLLVRHQEVRECVYSESQCGS